VAWVHWHTWKGGYSTLVGEPTMGHAERIIAEIATLNEAGMLLRRSVQFHWRNQGYADFDAFLATMSHDKRKKIKQERRRVREAGVRFRHVEGGAITPELWRFWNR